jgi:hypothetical protein
MTERVPLKKPNALKHGGYSTIGVLPGESRAEFEKHLKDVVDELGPNGAVERDIVSTIARLLWRKQNLATFRAAQLAQGRFDRILDDELENRGIASSATRNTFYQEEDQDPAAREEAERAARKQARNELGDRYEFVEDDIGTVDRLMAELEVEERLDAAIDKCLKRLLMLRGVKSMAVVPRSEPAQLHKPRDVNRSAA